MGLWDEPTKRTLGIRDKQILYDNAHGRCQGCGKKIKFSEMQLGHKRAYSRGGKTTLGNSVCLCYGCNKSQGTDSWATFLKKKNLPKISKSKNSLKSLKLTELKYLAKRYNIKVKSTVVSSGLWEERRQPSKTKYVNALSKVVDGNQVKTALKGMPKPKKKRRKRQESFW